MDKIKNCKRKKDPGDKRISAAQMKAGQKGRVVQIRGGHGIVQRLETLGIRRGREIKKISGHWMRGPVLLQQGNTQLALGFGMASKLLVEISEEEHL